MLLARLPASMSPVVCSRSERMFDTESVPGISISDESPPIWKLSRNVRVADKPGRKRFVSFHKAFLGTNPPIATKLSLDECVALFSSIQAYAYPFSSLIHL